MRTVYLAARFIAVLSYMSMLCARSGQAEVTADPMGMAAMVADEPFETEMILRNSGDEDVPFVIRNRTVDREERRDGPRRDDPGDVLHEFDLEYHYCLGFSWDEERSAMWATHTLPERIVAYEWNGEEVTEILADLAVGQNRVGCGYYDNVIYTSTWQTGIINMFDTEGENFANQQTNLSGIMGLTVDPEREYMFCFNFPDANIYVFDLANDFEQVGVLENILEQRDQDPRGRLNWVPEHDEGHLWVSLLFEAWQFTVDEDWNWELVQNFETESDVRSFGIGHDGDDLWISTAGINDQNFTRAYVVDDGINEARWLLVEPEEGVVPAQDEVPIQLAFNPVDMEPGIYELLMQIRLDDPDQPLIEMSMVLTYGGEAGSVAGIVTDAADDEPLEGMNIDMSYYLISRTTNENGEYSFDALPADEYDFTFTLPEYLPHTEAIQVEEGDEVEFNFAMLHSECNLDPERVSVELEQDSQAEEQVIVSNDGNGPLTYLVERKLPGGADAEPWEFRESFNVGEVAEDDRIMGVIFVDGRFYVSGGHDREPAVYIFNRDGDLEDLFAQPGDDNRGFRDLAWDGELLWGAIDNEVFGVTLEGEVATQFEGPVNPITTITWDSINEWLWMSSTTTDIFAYDRDGEEQMELDREGLRIYGLAFYPDDPDGYPLYVFHEDRELQVQSVNKYRYDGEDAEMVHVANLEPEIDSSPEGAFITNQYDVYSWVFMAIASASRNDGGDRVDVWQVESRLDWFEIDPDEGVIEAEEQQEFTITFDSADLPPVRFDGIFEFRHDGFDGVTELPVQMTVLGGEPEPEERVLELNVGWNMVSINVDPDEHDVVALTQPLVDEGLLELMKDGDGRFYSPEFEFNNIPEWVVSEGYQMKMSDDVEFVVEGMPVAEDTPIDLERSWQIVAYFPRVAVDARVALSGIEDDLTIAKDGEGRFYVPEFDFSNMGDMREGQGYQVKMANEAQLVYVVPDERLQATPAMPAVSDVALPSTGSNMSLLALGAEPGSELLVKAGDRTVGREVAGEDGCGIAVWGDDPTTAEIDGAREGERLELFRVESGDARLLSHRSLRNKAIYATDALWVVEVDRPEAPLRFGIVDTYPNPFNSSLHIGYNLPEATHVEAGLYDISGRRVQSISSGWQNAGRHVGMLAGEALSSGVYVVRIDAGGKTDRRKVVLVR